MIKFERQIISSICLILISFSMVFGMFNLDLKALTINAAWQIKMEEKIGSIKVGKYADFVVLDKNPLTIPKSELRKINVMATIVNGNTIFKKDLN